MMSWQPRMMPRKRFSFGPRVVRPIWLSLVEVRMWNDSGIPSSIAVS